MDCFSSVSSQGSRSSRLRFCTALSAALLALALAASGSIAPAEDGNETAAVTQIKIDARAPFSEPLPALYDGGTATSLSGSVIGVNSRYLTLNGKPWLPVMGEFHFSRYPRREWETEILKMKASGVEIISTYVFWIHHEEIRGQFDWTDQRDLRAFAQLCARHHMFLLVRIGPWDHGEVRNGGLPDWVIRQGPTRVNDPAYLASVHAWYGQVGSQLKGMLWKDGGPVIGIQLENEYSICGPGGGEAHILALKKIAIDSGLDVPLYLVTGWDDAVVPKGAVIPVYGGYAAAPWNGSISKLPPQEVYAFRFQSRIAANVNTDRALDKSSAPPAATNLLPYLTAEIGGGIEDTYHRRPVIGSDDIAAMFPVMLGSGVNLYGTYMFHGGENPDGKLTTLQESQATGYPNDLPINSYDFQAPLGEFGEERISLRKAKVFQYFLNEFGADLAPMAVRAPDRVPRDPADLSIPRASVRSSGDSGFIFFNNYLRGAPMPPRSAAQFEILLPGATLTVPRRPVDIPSGTYFIWPFNLRVAGLNLRYSTAQVFARTRSGKVTTLYFEAISGIPAEFAFDQQGISQISSGGEIQHTSDTVYVSGIKPGIDAQIEITSSGDETLRVVVLTQDQAEDAWRVKLDGSDHLLITAQDFVADPDSDPASIVLRSTGSPRFEFAITPPPADPPAASLPLTRNAAGKDVAWFVATAQSQTLEFTSREIKSAGFAPRVKPGPSLAWRPVGVAQAPAEGDLPQAAKWSIEIPPASMDGVENLFLQLDYRGDVARLSTDGHLLVDDFYNGQPWSVGLGRFLRPGGAGSFQLEILPLRKDAPVYLELAKPIEFPSSGQIGELISVKLVPQYQLEIGDSCKGRSLASGIAPTALAGSSRFASCR